MKQVVNIAKLDQAKVLLNPIRIKLLQQLVTPKTCAELAKELGMSGQRINAHLKELLKQGIIEIAERRRIRNLIEATYQARAKVFWFSPRILRDPEMDAGKFREQLSLNNLLVLAETVQEDVGQLLTDSEAADEIPNIGISAEVYLRDESERKQFTRDVLQSLAGVLEKYQAGDDSHTAYKATFICYPALMGPDLKN